MIPLPELLTFLVTALVIIVVPGPGVLFVICRALVLGTRGALLSVLGNAAGVSLQAIRHRDDLVGEQVSAVSTRTRTLVRDSVVVGITNPKTMVFFVAALPQAVTPEAGSPVVQMHILGALFQVIGTASDSVYAVAAGSARDWFASNTRRIATLRAAGGAALMLLGVIMAVTVPL